MLTAGVAILVSLGIIVARSQGRAQPSDTTATARSPFASPAPMTPAEIAELHAAVAIHGLR